MKSTYDYDYDEERFVKFNLLHTYEYMGIMNTIVEL